MQQTNSSPAPLWLPQSRLTPLPDSSTLDWLFDEGSLTRRLTRLSNDGFSVTPLFEGWDTLRVDECAALDLAEGSGGWVREVYLRGHDQAWVFARSVASRSALQGDGLHMDELGSRSLGELMYKDQAFRRRAIEVCHYPEKWLPPAAGRRVVGPSLAFRPWRVERAGCGNLLAELWDAARAHPENC